MNENNIETLLDISQNQMSYQLKVIESIEAKCQILLGFLGVILTIISAFLVKDNLELNLSISLGLFFLSLAMVFLGATLVAQRFFFGIDIKKFYEENRTDTPIVFKFKVISRAYYCLNKNREKIIAKTKSFNISLISAGIGLILIFFGIMQQSPMTTTLDPTNSADQDNNTFEHSESQSSIENTPDGTAPVLPTDENEDDLFEIYKEESDKTTKGGQQQ